MTRRVLEKLCPDKVYLSVLLLPDFRAKKTWNPVTSLAVLSGPISRDTAILSLRYPVSREKISGKLALPKMVPPSYLVSH